MCIRDRATGDRLHTSIRPSACPGLLRIVPALDGGICRIKLPGGVLRSAQAEGRMEAVSYTHLDVYKRQVLWYCPPPEPASGTLSLKLLAKSCWRAKWMRL